MSSEGAGRAEKQQPAAFADRSSTGGIDGSSRTLSDGPPRKKLKLRIKRQHLSAGDNVVDDHDNDDCQSKKKKGRFRPISKDSAPTTRDDDYDDDVGGRKKMVDSKQGHPYTEDGAVSAVPPKKKKKKKKKSKSSNNNGGVVVKEEDRTTGVNVGVGDGNGDVGGKVAGNNANSESKRPPLPQAAPSSAPGSGDAAKKENIGRKKKKRKGPWDVRVGSVVAVRHACGGIEQVFPPRSPDGWGDWEQKGKFSSSSPSRSTSATTAAAAAGGGHHGTGGADTNASASSSDNVAVGIWVDPIAGRDDGLALVGQKVRFSRSAMTAAASAATGGAAGGSANKGMIEGEVVAIQYPPTREQNGRGCFVVGVLVDEQSLVAQQHQQKGGKKVGGGVSNSGGAGGKGDQDRNGSSSSVKKSPAEDEGGSRQVPVQVTLKALHSCRGTGSQWYILRVISSTAQGSGSNRDNTSGVQGGGSPSFLGLANSTTVGGGGADPPFVTRRKVISLDRYYVGDGFDSARQQEKNWTWVARQSQLRGHQRRKRSRPTHGTTDCDASSCWIAPPFVGEVVSIDRLGSSSTAGESSPSFDGTDPSSAAATFVTMKRLWIPEHTARGRQYHQGGLDVFSDFASLSATCTAKGDAAMMWKHMEGMSFRVNLEDLIVVGKSITRDRGENGRRPLPVPGASRPPLIMTHSYSASMDEYIPTSLVQRGEGAVAAVNGASPERGGDESTFQTTTNTANEETRRCHGCSYRFNTSKMRQCRSSLFCGGCWWCGRCCKILVKSRTFPTSQSSKWTAPCCLGLCFCDSCRDLATATEEELYGFPESDDEGDASASTQVAIRDSCSICLYACAKYGSPCCSCSRLAHKKCANWEKAVSNLYPKPTFAGEAALGGDGGADESTGGRKNGSVSDSAVSGKKGSPGGRLCWRCTYGGGTGETSLPTLDGESGGVGGSGFLKRLSALARAEGPINFDLPTDFIESVPSLSEKPKSLKRQQLQHQQHHVSVKGRRNHSRPAKKKKKKSGRGHAESSGSLSDGVGSEDDVPTRLKMICRRIVPFRKRAIPENRCQLTDKVSSRKNTKLARFFRDRVDPSRKEKESSNSSQPDVATVSGRAARASNRRMLKDVYRGSQGLGLVNNLDMLAGREPRVRFGRSPIHRWGVYLEEDLSTGDMVMEYRGELIGNAVAEEREKEYERAKLGSDYMFRIDGTSICDGTKQGSLARFINASCDPNCYTQIINMKGTKRIVVYAKRDIRGGEELTYDYKFPIEYDESKRIKCNCGASNCRGFMNWDKRYVAIPVDGEIQKGAK